MSNHCFKETYVCRLDFWRASKMTEQERKDLIKAKLMMLGAIATTIAVFGYAGALILSLFSTQWMIGLLIGCWSGIQACRYLMRNNL